MFTFSWVSTQPLASLLVWTTKARQQGVEWTLNCWCFMRAYLYSVGGAWQETKTQTNLVYVIVYQGTGERNYIPFCSFLVID